MKNFRKSHIEHVWDLDMLFRAENPQRERLYQEALDKINNDKLVVDFWNLLVDYKKNDKEDYQLDIAQSALATSITSNILSVNGNGVLSTITALGAAGMLVDFAVNNLHKIPKAERIQASLEAMRVIEPELYNIELCFNKAPMHLIPMVSDGTNPEKPKDGLKYEPNFEGKDRYIELHNKLLKNKCLYLDIGNDTITILVNDKEKKNEDDLVTYECELPEI